MFIPHLCISLKDIGEKRILVMYIVSLIIEGLQNIGISSNRGTQIAAITQLYGGAKQVICTGLMKMFSICNRKIVSFTGGYNYTNC